MCILTVLKNLSYKSILRYTQHLRSLLHSFVQTTAWRSALSMDAGWNPALPLLNSMTLGGYLTSVPQIPHT